MDIGYLEVPDPKVFEHQISGIRFFGSDTDMYFDKFRIRISDLKCVYGSDIRSMFTPTNINNFFPTWMNFKNEENTQEFAHKNSLLFPLTGSTTCP